MKLETILNALQQIAPLEYAESWDNVGLLVGSTDMNVTDVMTCLTLTPTTLCEAIDRKAQLVVCHHPIPFKPLSRITSETSTGKLLLQAIQAGVAVHSPHTAWDNAKQGINQQLAEMLDLISVRPLQRFTNGTLTDDSVGVGRCGYLSTQEPHSIEAIFQKLGKHLPVIHPRSTHDFSHRIHKLGIVCGSGGSMLGLVASRGCDAMLTGEATYHQCLEAESRGVAMILIGHHASEAFAMNSLARLLQAELQDVHVYSSEREVSNF